MNISYFDDARVTEKLLRQKERQLLPYRERIAEADATQNTQIPEYSLYYAKDAALHEAVGQAERKAKGLKYVLLIGIGGQSLATEAVHAVLASAKGAKLLVLDTVSVSDLAEVQSALATCKKVSQVAVCVSSKSGETIEILANAGIILADLEAQFGAAIYEQTYFIGTTGTAFMKYGKKVGATCIGMPEVIGGRYSVATAAGLIPLALLGHDVDEFISGYVDVSSPTLESVVAESAARLALYQQFKFPHYNFFAFESRLLKLGQWYRQLFAESLGKEFDCAGKPVKHLMVPAIATPVELHSVGQLYMSGVADVYTDFVSFDDETLDVMIPKKSKLAKQLTGHSLQEVATALYGGVIGAYQEKQLPYRATVFEENLAYSIGQFMAMRLREVMYVAHLHNLNAFDQPNVELYKQKTREILFL
jgi:glucose-6-phosphate isomerase